MAIERGLMVFRRNRARDHHFVPLLRDQRIGALAAVSATEVAAVIHGPGEEDEIRIINVFTFHQQKLKVAAFGEQFHSLHSASAAQPALLVVSSKKFRSKTRYSVRVYSMDGETLAEAGLEAAGSADGTVEIVPIEVRVEPSSWAVLTRDGKSPAHLTFQRLTRDGRSWRIKTFGQALDGVRGACAIRDKQLAITRGDDVESYLETFNSDGKRLLQNRLFPDPDNAHFLLNCKPVAWHKSLGILLSGDASEDGGELWHVLPRHEELPRPVPKGLQEAICHKAFSTERHFLSLEDETALIALPSGALAAGPEPTSAVWLEGDLRPPHLFLEIMGTREDGAVIVGATAWLDRCGTVVEFEPRAMNPPGSGSASPDDVAKGFRTITPDGWELAISRRGRLFSARRRGTSQSLRRRLKRGRIADVHGDGSGGFIAAVVHEGLLRVHRFGDNGRRIAALGPLKVRSEPRIVAASHGLVFIDEPRGGRGHCIDLIGRRPCRIRDIDAERLIRQHITESGQQVPTNLRIPLHVDEIRILDLPNGDALVLLPSEQYELRHWADSLEDCARRGDNLESAANEEERHERQTEFHRAYRRLQAEFEAIQRKADAPSPIAPELRHNRFPALLFLHSPGSKPILSPIEGIMLSADTHVYDIASEQDGGFLLSTASIIETYNSDDGESQLTLERQTLRLQKEGER